MTDMWSTRKRYVLHKSFNTEIIETRITNMRKSVIQQPTQSTQPGFPFTDITEITKLLIVKMIIDNTFI
jgi:hypothetical protein